VTSEIVKVMSIVGARPQFIKASIITRRFKEKSIKHLIIHTGQHYDRDMSDIFFTELGIDSPDKNLHIGSGMHGEQTGKMLIAIEKEITGDIPDLVIVYGDTNSTLAGALAAAKIHVPVAHIEAGLRSFDKKMPEEINRVLTDHLSDLLFAPSHTAVRNLEKESLKNNVYNVGDVMFDTALEISRRVLSEEQEILEKFGLKKKNYVLATIHRQENTDRKGNLINIIEALLSIARSGNIVFFAVHPRTEKCMRKYGVLQKPLPTNLILNRPISYSEMIVLEKNARVIITDSGGMQKEAYFFKTPAIIPRNNSEWVEIIESGWNILTGADSRKILKAFRKLWEKRDFTHRNDLYGNGNASVKICNIISDFINKG